MTACTWETYGPTDQCGDDLVEGEDYCPAHLPWATSRGGA